MIDTHWLDNPRNIEVNFNDVTAATMELHDIKAALSTRMRNRLLDGDEVGMTIGDTLDSVIDFLTELERKAYE